MQQKQFKNKTGVDTSKFSEKIDLASLKSEIDKLNVGKLETTLVKNEVIKKTVYNELVKKS